MSEVMVERRTLRGMRSLVAGILVALLLLAGLVTLRLLDDQRRCKAGNQFRARDLPAAFRLHDEHLGRAFGADDTRVAEFTDEFETDLAELLPLRDCSLL